MNDKKEISGLVNPRAECNPNSSLRPSSCKEDVDHLAQKLRERETILKQKEVQIGCVFHDVRNLVSRLEHSYRFIREKENRTEDKAYDGDLNYCISHLHAVLDAFLLLMTPRILDSELTSLKNAFSIITQICSSYSPTRVQFRIIGSSLQSFKLNHSFDLAMKLVIDTAVTVSPNNSDVFITFADENDTLTVEFKYWEPSFSMGYKQGFGSSIIWNPEDKDVALNLFKTICDSNNIKYAFIKGTESKEFYGDQYQSCVLTLIFNSGQQ